MRAVTSVPAMDTRDQGIVGNFELKRAKSVPLGYIEVGIDIGPSRAIVLSGVFAVALLLTFVLFLTFYFG